MQIKDKMQKRKKKSVGSEQMEMEEHQPSTSSMNLVNNNGDVIDNEDPDADHILDDEEGGMRIGDIYIPPAPKPALSMESTGPRLIITQIVNENFKSYAGVQVLGPFHKSFTAIVGPNGSGKSNVIDSMLFVFGYRATKIRSKKISVLLHSSSRYPNITSACVAVHFAQIIDKPGDEYDIVPGSEIIVSRTAFKDNSSFYTLNGRRVQFKEVAKMLRSHNIDLDHNRFLILQGEVEQIAMMKPKAQNEHESGMLEYLEDIIGTSRYKEPIEKLSVRVEDLTEARKDKLNRVRLVEAEKVRLEEPMREAVEQLNVTNAVVRCRNTLLQKYIHETKKMMDAKNVEMTDLKETMKSVDERLTEIQAELTEKNTVLKNGSRKYEKLQQRKEQITEKLHDIKKKTVANQADNTQANKKKKNVTQLLEQEKSKLIDFEEIPAKNKKEIAECEVLTKKLTKDKEKLEEEFQEVMTNVRSQTQGLQETKDKLQSSLIELKRTEDEAKNKFKLAESELKIYLSSELSEADKLGKLKEALKKAAESLDEKQLQHSDLTSSIPRKEQEFQSARTELESIKKEEVALGKQVRSARAQLEESRQAMSANRSRGRVLDALMKEKANGNLTGIFGRLGDLGGIDVKYDVAISTCCGALDNIVVDTVHTAQACIDFLKKHDVGRATFIALEKQEHLRRQCEGTINTPENAPRLFDLVRVNDARVRPAFYYALRDTLVASDLEQASRIAYGAHRYRVVTLKGDLIEIAGTMSGGGKSVMRGRMSQKVQQDTSEQDPRAIEKEERQLAKNEERLIELRTRQSVLEERVSTLRNQLQQEKLSLNKLSVELKNLNEQVPVLKNQVKEQEMKSKQSVVDPRKKAELEKITSVAEKVLEEAKMAAGEVEKEVAEVDAKISAVAGGKVKALQKAIDELGRKIDNIRKEMTKLNVAINTSVRNAKKSREKIGHMETDVSETSKKLEQLAEQKKQLTLDMGRSEKELEEVEEELSEGSGEFSGLKEEIGKLQKKENKVKSERLEMQNGVSKLQKAVEEYKSKIPHWDKELGTLKLEDPGIEGVAGIEKPAPLAQHTYEELESLSVEELRQRVAAQKNRLGETKPNLGAIQEYRAKEELFLKRAAELEEITTRRNDMRALHEQLRRKRTADFLAGFSTITSKLKEMYQMITLGGDAELELVDSLDPFTEGIVFSVRPPNKSWKNISNLSGGEKTLSSLALVFALHYYKPTPLYVMDEIDAALDFKNVSIVANYIKERTKNAQFIIISLRSNMFEMANRLVGIYKTQDCTQSLSIENNLDLTPQTVEEMVV